MAPRHRKVIDDDGVAIGAAHHERGQVHRVFARPAVAVVTSKEPELHTNSLSAISGNSVSPAKLSGTYTSGQRARDITNSTCAALERNGRELRTSRKVRVR